MLRYQMHPVTRRSMSFHLNAEYFWTDFVFPEECSMQKKEEINNDDRNEKACDAEAKIDYGENVCVYV